MCPKVVTANSFNVKVIIQKISQKSPIIWATFIRKIVWKTLKIRPIWSHEYKVASSILTFKGSHFQCDQICKNE